MFKVIALCKYTPGRCEWCRVVLNFFLFMFIKFIYLLYLPLCFIVLLLFSVEWYEWIFRCTWYTEKSCIPCIKQFFRFSIVHAPQGIWFELKPESYHFTDPIWSWHETFNELAAVKLVWGPDLFWLRVWTYHSFYGSNSWNQIRSDVTRNCYYRSGSSLHK